MYKKGFTLIELLVVIAIIGILTAVVLGMISGGGSSAPKKNEVQQSNEVTKNLNEAVPIPQLTTSSERANVAKRAELFNNEQKISYIYLVSYGKVMAFYPVQGKVSSLRSYMSPVEKLIDGKGEPCDQWDTSGTCYVVEAADIDGTYGENVDGIFFFTTEGAYVEWKGEYMMSDQPLKLTTTPALVREIE